MSGKIKTEEMKPAWVGAVDTRPPVGEMVLTYGSYGFVVASCRKDGNWEAQHADSETGEPWLRDDAGKPAYWMPLPCAPL